jgi:hypothetical protein
VVGATAVGTEGGTEGSGFGHERPPFGFMEQVHLYRHQKGPKRF